MTSARRTAVLCALLAVALARADPDAALEHARCLLDPRQQPLPDEIASALGAAIAGGRAEDLEAAVEVARRYGYA